MGNTTCEPLDRARASGATTYFTGQPCKRGHVAARATASKTCVECLKLHAAAYHARHPGKLKEWRDQNIEAYRTTHQNWKKANPEKVRASREAHYGRHKEKILAGRAEWRAKNAERMQAMRDAWRLANPDKVAMQLAKRRASVRRAQVAWADQAEMQAIYARAIELSKLTGVPHEVDHAVPIIHPLVCGLHCPANLQVLPASVNRRKSNRFEVSNG